MSRFTWFAIKAELEDRLNVELQMGLQRSLGLQGAAAAMSMDPAQLAVGRCPGFLHLTPRLLS